MTGGGTRWPVRRPVEIYAAMPDLGALGAAILEDPGRAAAVDQFGAAQAEAVNLMGRAGPVWKETDTLHKALPDGPADRDRVLAWLIALMGQAGHRGLRRCPHIFRPGVGGMIHAGHAVAACRGCLPRYIGPMVTTRVADDRCEVCGELQHPPRFHPVMLPHGGVVVAADQCPACHEWLMGALGA